ncbi:MAG: alpha/beta hydrolase [Chloroflexi bacterium]|nr:alpha/beta hydrolase [Chloroflexota bacterium]MBM4428921.1 alpha/beta hydrolase [Chloroflexota bacterium]
MRTVLEYFWSDWRIGPAVAVGMAAGAGLISAWLTPRGPITTFQALVSMAAALVIGVAVGLVMGSRWSMLVTPAVFVVVFELARLGVDGPTVDGIHLGSTYGVIAFVLGRLVHGLLVLAPMILGTVYGVWLAGRLGRDASATMGAVGWTFTGLTTLALIVLAAFVARPATTHPIVGPDGGPLPGSIAELITVPIGGHDQALMIRGRSIENPVLLYLAGGPGGTDLGAMRADVGLEQDFVVVTWDQRGAGKSYSALDPVDTLTPGQMVADTIELTNYLRDRFDEDKIYLVGNSWGTILGVLAVQQHPELFHAYVGTGQMVSLRETDVMFYEDTLAWAERTGNDGLAETLRRNGPPPYDNLLDYEPAISHEHDWNPYSELDVSKEMPGNLFVPENSLMDRINGLRGFLDTFSVLYPQLQGIDFRRDVPSLDVPVYMVIGKHEARGRAVLANEWFDMLEAPSKEMIIFEHSGHRPLFEEPVAFASLMTRILDETYVND